MQKAQVVFNNEAFFPYFHKLGVDYAVIVLIYNKRLDIVIRNCVRVYRIYVMAVVEQLLGFQITPLSRNSNECDERKCF